MKNENERKGKEKKREKEKEGVGESLGLGEMQRSSGLGLCGDRAVDSSTDFFFNLWS